MINVNVNAMCILFSDISKDVSCLLKETRPSFSAQYYRRVLTEHVTFAVGHLIEQIVQIL